MREVLLLSGYQKHHPLSLHGSHWILGDLRVLFHWLFCILAILHIPPFSLVTFLKLFAVTVPAWALFHVCGMVSLAGFLLVLYGWLPGAFWWLYIVCQLIPGGWRFIGLPSLDPPSTWGALMMGDVIPLAPDETHTDSLNIAGPQPNNGP